MAEGQKWDSIILNNCNFIKNANRLFLFLFLLVLIVVIVVVLVLLLRGLLLFSYYIIFIYSSSLALLSFPFV